MARRRASFLGAAQVIERPQVGFRPVARRTCRRRRGGGFTATSRQHKADVLLRPQRILFDLGARLPERFDFGGQVAFQLGELPDHFAFQFLNGGDHATITIRPRHRRHREPHRRYQHGEAFADTTRPDGATFAMHQRLPFIYIAFNRIINKY